MPWRRIPPRRIAHKNTGGTGRENGKQDEHQDPANRTAHPNRIGRLSSDPVRQHPPNDFSRDADDTYHSDDISGKPDAQSLIDEKSHLMGQNSLNGKVGKKRREDKDTRTVSSLTPPGPSRPLRPILHRRLKDLSQRSRIPFLRGEIQSAEAV